MHKLVLWEKQYQMHNKVSQASKGNSIIILSALMLMILFAENFRLPRKRGNLHGKYNLTIVNDYDCHRFYSFAGIG